MPDADPPADTDKPPVSKPEPETSPVSTESPADPPPSERAEAEKAASEPLPETKAAAAPVARPSILFLVVVTVVSLVLDLGSKEWATKTLDQPGAKKVEVIAGHLNFVHAKNKGGAWGLLQDESESVRRPFFLLISAAAVVFILSLYRKLAPNQRALKWGLPLVLGGALGNLVDRIRYGHVVDFIDVRVTKDFTWPTFNIADVAICVGVGLMAIDMFTSRRPEPTVASPGASKDTPAPSPEP